MNARQNVKWVSMVEEQLNAIQMPQYERDAALHHLHIAELFVDAIAWVCSKFGRPDAGVFAKPNLKY